MRPPPADCWPVPGARVSSGYGWRQRPSGPDLHTGWDLPARRGTPAVAVWPGRVVLSAASGYWHGYGELVVLHHPDLGLWTLYAHLDRRFVVGGQQVAAGQPVGTVGSSAGSREDPRRGFANSRSHLHFEVLTRFPPRKRDENRVNPVGLIAICTATRANRAQPPGIPRRWEGHPTPRLAFPQRSSAGGAVLAVLAWLYVQRQPRGSSR